MRILAEDAKREAPCSGVVGLSHAWRGFGNPETRAAYSACVRCGVTESKQDYVIRLGGAS